MTLTANKFTPEVMLSAPRRSAGVPNPSGKLVLYTVSTYCFKEHKNTSQIKVLEIDSGNSTTVFEGPGASEPVWLGDNDVLYLKSGDNGSTVLIAWADGIEPYEVGSVKGPISNVKVKRLLDGTVAFACSAVTTPHGKLCNPETEKKPQSSAKVYTSLFVRHWDAWNTNNASSIFYGVIDKKDDKYSLRDNTLHNALAGTKLSSPVPPFGGTSDFDIGPSGLVFVAKDPELNAAIYTKTDLYFIPLKTFTESSPPSPQIVKTPGLEGYSNSPVFSHCGHKVAFTRMRSNQYESDKPRLLLVPDIAHPDKTEEFYATQDGNGGWDTRPESILWSHDDAKLYVTAEDRGRTLIVELPSSPSKTGTALPTAIKIPNGSVRAFYLLADPTNDEEKTQTPKGHQLFITTTSLIDNACYSITNPTTSTSTTIFSASKHGKAFNLSPHSISTITFPGAGGAYDIDALVVRPSSYSPSDPPHKYPLCMLIHGGPQGAWQDSWSTRWNPAVFAEQGYVVVCPNPTGSTGYGMALQDGIKGEWGGRPYNDLVRCFEWVVENLAEVDGARAVALGASYGGYMINWIQGHPLGRKFKALVCHDGVFSTLNQWCTEELFFPIHDFEGTLYDNRASYEKWDPARFVADWATPQLTIHSELDYRLPITEGLAAFNVLQAKKVPSKLLMFPDENHWVLKHENSLVWHREVIGWINKYSGIDEEQSLAEETERLKV
ncbi:Alpha/Beta hydrolase protein [Chaetomium fimeti]|uniref:Dipeptidyl-peptidase V n=1 Tax=Chaetomium fimeti TaxID=1854472 RepID=A0AAE0HP96_9PEZI|nr:Alpha/Beta hydrolase protein [Chaetomium fimeti]